MTEDNKGQGNGGKRRDHSTLFAKITVAVGQDGSDGPEYYWSVTPPLASMVAPQADERIHWELDLYDLDTGKRLPSNENGWWGGADAIQINEAADGTAWDRAWGWPVAHAQGYEMGFAGGSPLAKAFKYTINLELRGQKKQLDPELELGGN